MDGIDGTGLIPDELSWTMEAEDLTIFACAEIRQGAGNPAKFAHGEAGQTAGLGTTLAPSRPEDAGYAAWRIEHCACQGVLLRNPQTGGQTAHNVFSF